MNLWLIPVVVIVFIAVVAFFIIKNKKNNPAKKTSVLSESALKKSWRKEQKKDDFGKELDEFSISFSKLDFIGSSDDDWFGGDWSAKSMFIFSIRSDGYGFLVTTEYADGKVLYPNRFRDMSYEVKIRNENDERLTLSAVQFKSTRFISFNLTEVAQFVEFLSKSVWVDMVFKNLHDPTMTPIKIRIKRNNFNLIYDEFFVDGIGVYYEDTFIGKLAGYVYVSNEKLLGDINSDKKLLSALDDKVKIVDAIYDEENNKVNVSVAFEK